MSGAWTVTYSDIAPIHTYTAPEESWLVNSHIVELPSELFLVDAQYTLPNARTVARYARELGKPLTRLYVSHYHPDHVLGAAVLDAPLYAIESVAAKIAMVGDRVAREEHEKIGDDAPSAVRQPDLFVAEGEELVDGVRLQYRRLQGAETQDALTVALPDAGAVIVQDLVYNCSHPFLGERRFAGWRAALSVYRALPYDVVLPGHGRPGGKALYDSMLRYLDAAEEALTTAGDPAEFRARMIELFPEYGGLKVLDHQLRFLFPAAAHA